MRLRLLVLLVITLVMMTACQGQPPTVMIMVITSTPDISASPSPATDQSPTPPPTAIPPTPAVTPTLDPHPTPTLGQIQMAEQLFEGGRMFWIQPRDEIWVMLVTEEGRGTWSIYTDTFEEGETEYDPELIPPDNRYQPRRGFGKLWRENPELREQLGWAVTDEFGYVSRYEYHPGGTVDTQGHYIPGPGYHILFSLYEEAFRFNETDGTWQLGRGEA